MGFMVALKYPSIPRGGNGVKSEIASVPTAIPASCHRMPERKHSLELGLTFLPYFCNYGNMSKPDPILVARSADRFSALGSEPRLQIVRLLLSAHPTGMVVGEIQEELDIPASTLSHHLEKLKQVGLVQVRRDGTFLWYSASTDALRELLGFLYEECCTRSRAVPAESIVQLSK
jgi:ArsR family transcriptional regulator, arsenate/arsenite/antimonite-responsive transcriptional repressor